MSFRMMSAPVSEPLTLAELKAHLDLDGDEQDELLTSFIVAARTTVERLSGQLLLTQSWKITIDAVPPGGLMNLPLGPVQTVTSVTVYDAIGVGTIWPAATYTLDLVGEPARLLFHGGRPIPGRRLNGIDINVICGFGTSADVVPADLVQAVRLLAAHWYAARGNAIKPSDVPADVERLTACHRRLRLMT